MAVFNDQQINENSFDIMDSDVYGAQFEGNVLSSDKGDDDVVIDGYIVIIYKHSLTVLSSKIMKSMIETARYHFKTLDVQSLEPYWLTM